MPPPLQGACWHCTHLLPTPDSIRRGKREGNHFSLLGFWTATLFVSDKLPRHFHGHPNKRAMVLHTCELWVLVLRQERRLLVASLNQDLKIKCQVFAVSTTPRLHPSCQWEPLTRFLPWSPKKVARKAASDGRRTRTIYAAFRRLTLLWL